MANLEKKRLNKLKKVNVPELFYEKFIADLPASQLTSKISNTVPTPRGRGMSRVVENITNDEWNELYTIAAAARASVIGADRNTHLRATVCAKALANRMETLGVDNPTPYTPKKIYKSRAINMVEVDDVLDAVPEVDDAPVAAPTIPSTPLNIEKVTDLEEMPEEEQDSIAADLKSFINW